MSVAILKIAIADDEPLARLRLQQLCDDLNDSCPNQVCASYEHGTAMINSMPRWTAQDAPDVLLLDINMPGLTGIEIAAHLKQYAPNIAIIFVTAEPQHALEAFDVSALDYVLKPVRAGRLLDSLIKAKAHHQAIDSHASAAKSAPAMLLVHDGANALNVSLAHILYFKSNNKTTLVRTVQKTYDCSQSLVELENWLASIPNDFVRIHRNAMIARTAIGEVLDNNETLITVQGVSDQLTVSRRMLPSLPVSVRQVA